MKIPLKRRLRWVYENLVSGRRQGTEHYDKEIPAEIVEDDFFELLSYLSERDDLYQFLEIGSSSGEGSTKAIVSKLKDRVNVQIHCMEISKVRHENVQDTYGYLPMVKIHRLSTVGLDSFPTKREVKRFYKECSSNLNHYSLAEIYSWLDKDILYLSENRSSILNFSSDGREISGISFIQEKYGIDSFDFVLIDGGEFVGWAEYQLVYGAKVICLDDINSYKCGYAYDALMADVNYQLIAENWKVRNGWAAFERSDEQLQI